MNQETINLQYTIISDPLPDFIYEKLAFYSKNANGYKPQPKELIETLAKKHNLLPEMIYLTAGIDEAIQMFAKAYGTNTYVFTPTYIVYGDVEEFGGKLNKIPSVVGSEYAITPNEIKDASLIFLANPNNPSGITPKDKVMELVRNNPHARVVIDEAYGDFADLSVLDEVRKYSHMAVFRSFSKSYGMAGNRIGYIIAHPEVINVVKHKTQWANVSYLSAGAALVALEHEDHFKKMRDDINVRREIFAKFLTSRGFVVFPSGINAVLLKFSDEAEGQEFVNFLGQANIIGSHGNGNSNIGLDKSYVRIAIGTPEQMSVCKNVISSWQE